VNGDTLYDVFVGGVNSQATASAIIKSFDIVRPG
jgi:hypothetical protein